MQEVSPTQGISLHDAYQPPSQRVIRKDIVSASFSKEKKISVFNRSHEKSFFSRSFSTVSELQFRGQFNLTMNVQLGTLTIRQQKFKSFSFSSFHRFHINVMDRDNSDLFVPIEIEHHLPFLYPLTDMGIRIIADHKTVFEQGIIPERFTKVTHRANFFSSPWINTASG